MSERLVRRLRKGCGILLSISIAAAAVCLAVQCLRINAAGARPFSWEAVASAYLSIRLPVRLCLGLAAGSCLLHRLLPPVQQLPSHRPASEKPKHPHTGAVPGSAVRGLLLVLALGMLAYGFATGGAADVLTKAANICTECVGLG